MSDRVRPSTAALSSRAVGDFAIRRAARAKAVKTPAEHRVDPTWPDVVAAVLALSSAAAPEASHELLAPHSDTDDAPIHPAADTLADQVPAPCRRLPALADVRGEAGVALQRYATDLAEGHELGRRAQRCHNSASLLFKGTRVVGP